METRLPTPMTTRVYVNLPEGNNPIIVGIVFTMIQWTFMSDFKCPLKKKGMSTRCTSSPHDHRDDLVKVTSAWGFSQLRQLCQFAGTYFVYILDTVSYVSQEKKSVTRYIHRISQNSNTGLKLLKKYWVISMLYRYLKGLGSVYMVIFP